MLFHIRVTPVPDEPLLVTRGQALAGLDWLNNHLATGVLLDALPFARTGGYMNVQVPAHDEVSALRQLAELLADYPLLPTIDFTVDVLLPTLEDGFAVLLNAIDAHERVGA